MNRRRGGGEIRGSISQKTLLLISLPPFLPVQSASEPLPVSPKQLRAQQPTKPTPRRRLRRARKMNMNGSALALTDYAGLDGFRRPGDLLALGGAGLLGLALLAPSRKLAGSADFLLLAGG